MQGRKKHIKNGFEYDKYFKPSKKKNTEIPRADVMQTLEIMQNIVFTTLPQTKEISEVLSKKDVYNTCLAIWLFLYEHFQYKLDKSGVEQLREPNRSWADRMSGIDCDCFSIFASSILTNQEIDHSFRITKYNGNEHFQHVYVVVNHKGREIIIDPVVDAFDYQKPFSEKHDKPMKIRHQVLSGFGNATVSAPFGYEFDHIYSSLGNCDNSAMVESTKTHLMNTLSIVQKSPEMISDFVNPQTYVNQLQMVLQNWDNPITRIQAIEKAESMTDGLSGLNGWLSNTWNTVKTAVSNTAQKVGTAAKKVIDAVVTYNPLSLAMRGGLLLAFKVNLFHFTEKLKFGYLTESQAQANGINMSKYRQIKEVLTKVEGMFEKIGGDKEKLKSGILNGRKGSLSDLTLSPEALKPTPTINTATIKAATPQVAETNNIFEAQASFGSLGVEPATTAAATTAASGLLATIGTWFKNIDFQNLFNKAGDAKGLIDSAKGIFNNGSSNQGNGVPTYTLPTHTVQASQGMSTTNKLLIGGGVLAAVGILVYAMKPKRTSRGLGTVEVAI